MPVVDAATQAVKMLSATLLPAMQQIQPIIQEVVNVALGVFDSALEALAIQLETLIPLIRLAADIFDALSPVMRAIGVVMAGLYTALQSVIESLIEGIRATVGSLLSATNGTTMKDAFREIAKWAILAAASIAKFVGATDIIAGMRKSLTGERKKESADGLAAATNASFSSFADFGNKVALSAALAGQGGRSKEDDEKSWRADVLSELEALQAGQQTSLDKLGDLIADKISDAVSKVLDGLKRKTYEGASNIAAPVVASSPVLGTALALFR
jgi:hypothetical protein